jgi:hypothetical protein
MVKIRNICKAGMVMHTCNTSTLEVEAGLEAS